MFATHKASFKQDTSGRRENLSAPSTVHATMPPRNNRESRMHIPRAMSIPTRQESRERLTTDCILLTYAYGAKRVACFTGWASGRSGGRGNLRVMAKKSFGISEKMLRHPTQFTIIERRIRSSRSARTRSTARNRKTASNDKRPRTKKRYMLIRWSIFKTIKEL